MTAATMLDPNRTALLLMDFQNAAVGMFPDVDERAALVGRVVQARATARAVGAKVVYIRVTSPRRTTQPSPRPTRPFLHWPAAGS
jgi:nicotinamidase-related amidase